MIFGNILEIMLLHLYDNSTWHMFNNSCSIVPADPSFLYYGHGRETGAVHGEFMENHCGAHCNAQVRTYAWRSGSKERVRQPQKKTKTKITCIHKCNTFTNHAMSTFVDKKCITFHNC